jgi:hypothetical protein
MRKTNALNGLEGRIIEHPAKNISSDNKRIILIIYFIGFYPMVRWRRHGLEAVRIKLPQGVIHGGPDEF